MAIPDYQTLMLPVLQLASEGEQRVADVVDLLADRLGLTEEDRQKLLPSGRQRVLHNRIHWAKFYLTKAGFLSSPGRGRFSLMLDASPSSRERSERPRLVSRDLNPSANARCRSNDGRPVSASRGTRTLPEFGTVQVGNGRLGWRRPGVHTHYGGYGFRAHRFAMPRNDD
jgi:Mrr N-terminal domain